MVRFQLSIEEQRYGIACLQNLKEIKSKNVFKKEMKQFAQQRYDSDLKKNARNGKSCFE